MVKVSRPWLDRSGSARRCRKITHHGSSTSTSKWAANTNAVTIILREQRRASEGKNEERAKSGKRCAEETRDHT